MTDLTEQWKKGELDIDECYFAETEGGIYKTTGEYLNNSSCIHGFDIISILEIVPSYDEWEKLNWYAGNGVEKNQELKMENAQLKELLKECKRQFEEVELYRYDVADTDQEDWFKISTEQAAIANKMIAKIGKELEK